MDYKKISKTTVENIYAAHSSLNDSPLDRKIRVLVELRVSQINGCAFCCQIHSKEAREAGVSQLQLDQLAGWKSSSAFTEKQTLALSWCEAVTLLQDQNALKSKLLEVFTEREIVDLTIAISLMNTLNRLSNYLRSN